MSNIKTIEERIKKLEERKMKSAQSFGEIIIDEMDVSTPTEFRKFIRNNSDKLNKFFNDWREEEERKTNEKKPKQKSEQKRQETYFSE